MSSGGHTVNLVEQLPGVGSGIEPLVSALLIVGLIFFLSRVALRQLANRPEPLIPEKKLSLSLVFELIAELIVSLGDTAMGKRNRKYLPFVGSIFLYLFFLNLLGLVPGFSMPTDLVAFNLGVSLVVFVLYNYWGIRQVGVATYLKHLLGPVAFIAPLMFVVEVVSHIVRPVSLSLRLYGNMTGDHIVLKIFTDMTKFPIPIVFYCLGAFVCFMQAFVFTLLTMVYIRMAVEHEENH